MILDKTLLGNIESDLADKINVIKHKKKTIETEFKSLDGKIIDIKNKLRVNQEEQMI